MSKLTHWAGVPIETMTREQLLVVVQQLGRQLMSMRGEEVRVAAMHRAFAAARRVGDHGYWAPDDDPLWNDVVDGEPLTKVVADALTRSTPSGAAKP